MKRKSMRSKHDPVRLTVVTSEDPATLTKGFELRDGELVKIPGGQLVSGKAEVRELANLGELADVLTNLDASQALIHGVPREPEIGLTTRGKWEAMGQPPDVVPRTKEHFHWPNGPAIMMLDYDPLDGQASLAPGDLVGAIKTAAPGLKDASMLHLPSASSFIVNKETGDQLAGLKGQRLYLVVEDGSDIPRAGNVLVDRLWLAGHGQVKISSAGTLLERSLLDAAVWQPNRLDFAAGAHCRPPLVQERGSPRFFDGSEGRVDTRKALPDLDEQEAALLRRLQGEAREGKEKEAAGVRAAYIEARALELAGPSADERTIDEARKRVHRALETRRLPGDYLLEVELDGQVKPISVEDVLAAPDKFDGALARDAFEPGYDGGRLVGKLYLDGTTKTLHSFAHGGITYVLERGTTFITILAGQLDRAVDETLDVLRDHPEFFDFGEELAWVSGGQVHPLDEHRLAQKLGGVIQYQALNAKGNPVPRDPPANLVKRLLAQKQLRRLKPLSAVITVPTLRPDGSILAAQGYDEETQLYLHLDGSATARAIPAEPSRAEVKTALDRLMLPFKDFPFVEPLDRGIYLAALITTAVRGILPTSPGFGFDAPVQGSGKTLLAECVAVLAGGKKPTTYPHVSGRDDEEVRKRLMSVFRTGAPAMIWDNVTGTFDSASLAAALTGEVYADRLLGKSEIITLPNKAIFLFTGNNLTLQGDLVRRVLVARIDPRTDQPFARRFELDPLAHVLEHRVEMIAAALTLLRGYLSSNAGKPEGRMASFEEWSDLVRDAVCWISGSLGAGAYEDPMKAVTRALENDPELELLADLLAALRANFGKDEFKAADIYKAVRHEPSGFQTAKTHEIWEALSAIDDRIARSASTIGKALSLRKDRVAGGLVLRTRKDGHTKKSLWWVEEAKALPGAARTERRVRRVNSMGANTG